MQILLQNKLSLSWKWYGELTLFSKQFSQFTCASHCRLQRRDQSKASRFGSFCILAFSAACWVSGLEDELFTWGRAVPLCLFCGPWPTVVLSASRSHAAQHVNGAAANALHAGAAAVGSLEGDRPHVFLPGWCCSCSTYRCAHNESHLSERVMWIDQ